MSWKCVPQLIGLVRGEPKPGQKHRANGLKICMEAGEERASRSKTLDRSRSDRNRYSGYASGADCWAAMEAEADAYRITGTNKNGKEFSRKLRADAVIGWAMIFHPPADVAAGWPLEKRAQFVRDSWTAMEAIEPRLFRAGNRRMVAKHRDEVVDHHHIVGDARDEDGKYCGNLIDAALLQRICAEYPQRMRALGWEIEDCEITDWQRYGEDPEYRDAVDARKAAGPGGMTVNEYMASRAAQRAEDAARMYGDAARAEAEADERLGHVRKMEAALRERQRAERPGAWKDFGTRQQRVAEAEKQLGG